MIGLFLRQVVTSTIGRHAVCAVAGGLALAVAACAPTAPSSTPASSVGQPTPATTGASRVMASLTSSRGGPQDCVPDSKLLGRFAVSVEDNPTTWWRLTKQNFISLGITDYKQALEGFFGISFPDLAHAIQYLIDGVRSFDKNGNGWVCGYELPGTRAHYGIYATFLFGIADDKHVAD